MQGARFISSTSNPRVRDALRLRRRSHRDKADLLLVEGFREVRRAADNGYWPRTLFFCTDFFLGENEPELIEACGRAGTELVECARPVFAKLSYRDRPDGILALSPQLHRQLGDLRMPGAPLLIVAEAIEKPGNLGTILRSADGAGADAVIVCDRCTDLSNPNVVRASVGTLFCLPVAEASSNDTLAWLRKHDIRILAATPHAKTVYYDAPLAAGVAIVVGTEQYGLSDLWLKNADLRVRIPMRGQSDSLNVGTATTLLLYEALRQRKLS